MEAAPAVAEAAAAATAAAAAAAAGSALPPAGSASSAPRAAASDCSVSSGVDGLPFCILRLRFAKLGCHSLQLLRHLCHVDDILRLVESRWCPR